MGLFTCFSKKKTVTQASLASTDAKTVPSTVKPIQDLAMLDHLSDEKFQVFLVQSKSRNCKLILKTFPLSAGKMSQFFLRESRLMSLDHQNVIKAVDTRDKEVVPFSSRKEKVSFVLMEYAQFGDFCSLVADEKLPRDETLSRTYFHQLVEGMEYLHKKNIAHLDLKLDNLFLSDDYVLKIGDFDISKHDSESEYLSKGTRNYRPPEIIEETCKNAYKADIFSMGVLLFLLNTRAFPYSETKNVRGHDLFDLLLHNIDGYWEATKKIKMISNDIDPDFQDLFEQMVCNEPSKRISIEQIKAHKWYNGKTYSQKELASHLAPVLAKEGDSDAHTSPSVN